MGYIAGYSGESGRRTGRIGGRPQGRGPRRAGLRFPVRRPAAIAAGILLALLGACAGGAAVRGEGPGPRDGVWEGSGRGWGGEIRVLLRINSSLIQEIEILPHSEDPFIGGEAMGELLELVLDYQSAGLDAVSGATESSAGFLAAVEDALNRAGRSGN